MAFPLAGSVYEKETVGQGDATATQNSLDTRIHTRLMLQAERWVTMRILCRVSGDPAVEHGMRVTRSPDPVAVPRARAARFHVVSAPLRREEKSRPMLTPERSRPSSLARALSVIALSALGACGGGGGGGSSIPAPAGLDVSTGVGGVTLTWNAVPGARSYNLYCASQTGIDKTNWSTLPGGQRWVDVTSPFHPTSLVNGVVYFFVVTALDATNESAPSVEVSITALSTPDAPVGLTASAGDGEITLRWNAVAGATSYCLYRAKEPGLTPANYASLDGGEKTSGVNSPWVVGELANLTDYFFIVTAENPVAESAGSLQVAAAPLTRGWFWQSPLPTGNDLSRVELVNATTGWIVGAAGTILHTSDGSRWTAQASGTTASLRDVDFVDALSGWAVGGAGPHYATHATILHTWDGGASWTIQASGNVPSLNGVAFVDAVQGWAVGDGGTLLHTSDGGVTWTTQVSHTEYPLWKLAFSDARTGFVVGGSGYDGVVLRTTDGGVNWSAQTFWQTELYDVTFPTALRGWVVDASQSGQILATNNGGTSWGTLPTPTTALLRGIHFIDAQFGWAVGTTGAILRSTNGGGSWNLQSSGTAAHLNAVRAVSGQTAWAVGDDGVILHTTDGGNHWDPQQQSSWASTPAFLGASFADDRNGWIVGRSIWHTGDGGDHWNVQLGTTPDLLWDVDFVDPTRGWAVGDGSLIVHTVDGGSTWLSQDSNGAAQLWGVDFVDANSGWAVGPLGVIRTTTDGGSSWLVRDSGTFALLQDVSAISATTAWVVGDGGVILKTTDGGATWLGQLSGTLADLRAIHAIDAERACAVGGNGYDPPLLVTTDGGTNWFSLATTSTGLFSDVRFASASTGWVLGSDGLIFGTTDGGLTWQRQNSTTDKDLYSLCAISPTTAWAIGHGLLKTSTGGR